MCGCTTHQTSTTQTAADSGILMLKVDDMTCGHCASTIIKAVEGGLPGVKVEADPTSKSVVVRGSTDLAAVMSLIGKAGYSPTAA